MTDLRIAVRALRRSPGFTAIAMLTMAAAIGANTAMFSVFDRLILHAVEVPNPSSLVAIWFNNPQRNIQTPSSSIPRYEELRAYAKPVRQMIVRTVEYGRPRSWRRRRPRWRRPLGC